MFKGEGGWKSPLPKIGGNVTVFTLKELKKALQSLEQIRLSLLSDHE